MRIVWKPEKFEAVFRCASQEEYEELQRLAKRFEDAEHHEAVRKETPLEKVVSMGGEGLRRTNYRKPKEHDPNIFRIWNLWYVLLKKYFNVIAPRGPSGEETGNVITLLKEYGPDVVEQMFKVCMMDWPAFKTKMKVGSDAPNLKLFTFYRRDFAAAVSLGGVTTAKQRVSKYGQDGRKAAEEWEK